MPRGDTGNLIWNYFDKVDSVNKEAECRLCHNVYKYLTTSHNLKLHLKHKHNEIFLKMPSAKRMERKQVSGPAVWTYFERLDGEKKLATCNLCSKVISYLTTTANLRTHLRLVHKEMFGEPEEEEGEIYLEDGEYCI